MKVTSGRAKVEYDDAAAAARQLQLPVREVLIRAEQVWRAANPTATDDRDLGGDVIEFGPWFGREGPGDDAS